MTETKPEISLQNTLTWLEAELKTLGSDEAPQEARWILAHLGYDALKLKLDSTLLVPSAMQQTLETILARRRQREPLQYILECAYFWDLTLRVTPDVLIPRPETEELAALALELIPPQTPWRIAEMGTGSGAIPIALAQARPLAEFWASDLSPTALTIAQENGKRYHCHQIHWLTGDGLAPLAPQGPYDLFISNPPYVPEEAYQTLAPEVRNYEPKSALTPGPNPLHFYQHFARDLPQLLNPGAWVLLELEAPLAAEIAALFQAPFKPPQIHYDLQKQPRFLKVQIQNAGA